jgi:hypothetical protein
MKRFVLFAFNGELMCFVHVLLNALDMEEQGHEVKVVVEGSATKLIPDLVRTENPMHGLYTKVKQSGLIDGACRACSAKMGVQDAMENAGLNLLDEMKGHPSMARYYQQGFEVITF